MTKSMEQRDSWYVGPEVVKFVDNAAGPVDLEMVIEQLDYDRKSIIATVEELNAIGLLETQTQISSSSGRS